MTIFRVETHVEGILKRYPESSDRPKNQKRAEYGFGEYGFLSLLFVCQGEPTEFGAELTEFAPKLSELSLPKQYFRNSIPPVS